ncbi:MAG TPA: amidohydrolase, partial [Pirellulaceae bacterium]|nr:amidohydrolase [Pirellulaceae bacterium]
MLRSGLLAMLLLVLPAAAWAQVPEPADLVLLNGTIVTMVREGDVAEAVAVRGGKIAAVGPAKEIRPHIGPKTKVVDLTGKTLLPGFFAAHDHFPSVGRVALYDVDLNSPPIGTIRTMEELVAALREKAARTPAGQWVVGRGYDDTLLAEQRHPTRQDLDRASADHPIWIVHTSGHLGVANSRALALAKIDKDTPQPAGGAIRKDAAGEPTGVIEERTGLVNRLVPGLSQEQRLAAVKLCDGQYLAKGVTTTVIAGGAANVIPDLLAAHDRGWLHLRALAMLSPPTGEPPTLAELAGRSPIPQRVRYSGVKILQDGSLQGYTGYLTAPYFTQPEGRSVTDGGLRWSGYALRPREKLVELVGQFHRAGYQIAIHANGDAAIDDVLTAFRVAQAEHPRADARHRIEHCQTPREDQLDQMKELGITPSFFVGHVYYWGDRHQRLFLGQQRAERISPLASAAKRGIRFTIHNDTPVTPVDPLLLVWCAVTRTTKAGQTLGPEQRITAYAALRAVTIDAA